MSQRQPLDFSDKGEISDLRLKAASVFGLKFQKKVQVGSERNMVGIRSEHLLFSRRLDSRTYFIQNSQHGINDKAGVFRGSESKQIGRCKGILRTLRIPLSELDTVKILKEQTQVAQVNQETREVRIEEVQEGKHIAWVTRNIEGIPVWSSRLLLSLTQTMEIGFMELHWPEIPGSVVMEAHRLAYKVEHKWHVPDHSSAIPQSVEAGIIHSPAMGFMMDICPAIRVIYGSGDEKLGGGAVVYFDRDGRPVQYPRQIELPTEAPRQRKPLEQDKYNSV
jgi:hypothetical protein